VINGGLEMQVSKRRCTAIGALLIAMLLLALVPVATLAEITNESIPTSEPIAINTSNDIGLYPNNEQEKFVFDAINACDLSSKEKKDLIKNLKQIWSGNSKLSESKQQSIINQTAIIVIDFYNIDMSDEITIEWASNNDGWVHQDLATDAGTKIGTGYLDVLYSHATDPDFWGLPQMIQHYSWGGASDKCKFFADSARNYIKNQNNPTAGFTDLSVSMHYMSDVANPWHTKPLEYQTRHTAYENYVCQNWNDNQNYYDSICNDGWYLLHNRSKSCCR
jgi:hypothetical protein